MYKFCIGYPKGQIASKSRPLLLCVHIHKLGCTKRREEELGILEKYRKIEHYHFGLEIISK